MKPMLTVHLVGDRQDCLIIPVADGTMTLDLYYVQQDINMQSRRLRKSGQRHTLRSVCWPKYFNCFKRWRCDNFSFNSRGLYVRGTRPP